MMPRLVDSGPQRINLHGREHVLPPQTSVTLNFTALHTDPKYWGSDAVKFRPSRWIIPDEKAVSGTQFFEPASGSYMPWNNGPRICPGRKFSQVEFVRVVYGLFAGGTRVRLFQEPGESLTDAKERAMKVIADAKVEVTLKMVDSVGLCWETGL